MLRALFLIEVDLFPIHDMFLYDRRCLVRERHYVHWMLPDHNDSCYIQKMNCNERVFQLKICIIIIAIKLFTYKHPIQMHLSA